MKLQFKKLHQLAITPKYAKYGDAGFDLTAVSKSLISENQYKYNTGLAFEIPTGYVGLIFPRSSIVFTSQRLANCVGVIDSGYRGEVSFVFDTTESRNQYNIGDRIGQMVIVPFVSVELEEVTELSESERGAGGYGSTNR